MMIPCQPLVHTAKVLKEWAIDRAKHPGRVLNVVVSPCAKAGAVAGLMLPLLLPLPGDSFGAPSTPSWASMGHVYDHPEPAPLRGPAYALGGIGNDGYGPGPFDYVPLPASLTHTPPPTQSLTSVPEPSTFWLLLGGTLVALWAIWRDFNRRD